jgi:serine/threonine protein kinase
VLLDALEWGDFGMTNWIGEQLGSYRLVDLIGQGSFADVYVGEHLQYGSYAAIKVLQVQLDDSIAIEQFHAETRTLAKLTHPHIIHLLDAGIQNTIPFLVMDYAAGGTLRQRHPGGTMLPLPRIVSYIQQVADALHYAHEQKLIHRDVKPGNMFVGQHGTILLGDFGLALNVQSGGMVMPHEVAGSVPYMAPEQLAGQPCYASDQYALAAVVYEWLCGMPPLFDHDGQPMHAAPLPLHERVPGIAPIVEDVVLIGLAADPADRFVSVRAFATALELAEQGYSFDPRLLARSAEPVLTIATTDPIVTEQTTSDDYAVTLVASAEMSSLVAKTFQVAAVEPAISTLPETSLSRGEEPDTEEEDKQPVQEQSITSRAAHQEHARITAKLAYEERRSTTRSITLEEEPEKTSSPILSALIFIILVLIIIGGIFAAFHLFM